MRAFLCICLSVGAFVVMLCLVACLGFPKPKTPNLLPTPPQAAAEKLSQRALDENEPLGFKEGRQAAAADFRRAVRVAFNSLTWVAVAGAVGSLALGGLSFAFPWASLRAAGIGLALSVGALAVSLGCRYFLLAYGTLTVDILVWVALGVGLLCGLGFGVPTAVSWFRRHVATSRVPELVNNGDARAATALAATVNRKADKARKEILSTLSSKAGPVKAKLKRLGVTGVVE